MRTLPLLLAATLLPLTLSATAADGQKTFEGVITYDMSTAGQSMQIKQMAKGSMIRQEMEGPAGSMISLMDTGDATVTMIMPSQKIYMTMDVDAMMQQAPEPQPEQPDPAEFKATGEKETIAGHSCEHHTYTSEDSAVDMCVATGLGFLPFRSPGTMGNRGGGMGGMDRMEEWRKRFPDGFVPLSVDVTAQGSNMTMRATAVEPKTLSDDLFEVPAGYTKMSTPGR
ncbi:MAG: DUF4412 domain-containing protein [Planctomycetaceae bacterium]